MDLTENLGGGVAPTLTSSPPLGPSSYHPTSGAESQPQTHNSRRREDDDDSSPLLSKNTQLADEDSPLAGELDMFDIELQKEFQAASLRSVMPGIHRGAVKRNSSVTVMGVGGNNHINSGAGFLNAAAASNGATVAGISGRGGLSYSALAPLATPARGHAELPPPASAAPGKQFSSVAGAYQLSVFTQDLERSIHLIHTLASDIRREMQAAGSIGNNNSNNLNSNGGGGVCSTTPSPATFPIQHNSGASFEEDLRLVTTVVQDINQSYYFSSRSPSSQGGVHIGTNAAQPPATHTASGNVLRVANTRASPAGGRSSGYNYNNGRSTIDTEVSDSLCRINHISNSPGFYHEYEVRPVNPYQGVTHGFHTTPRHAPQTQHPSALFNIANGLVSNMSPSNPASTPIVIQHLEHVTLSHGNGCGGKSSNTPMPLSKKASGTRSACGNHAQVVAHPRAVKPQTESATGRSRGPRSQSGKNVAPSNHSAFSECSGGETRSYQSTTTAFRQNYHNISYSADVTTNTSLSSALFHPSNPMVCVNNNTTNTSVNGNNNNNGSNGCMLVRSGSGENNANSSNTVNLNTSAAVKCD